MGVVAWVFLGLVSGLLASHLVLGTKAQSLTFNCAIGIAGALLGGWAAVNLFRLQTLNTLFNLSGWLTALTGAAILLLACYALAAPGPHAAGMPAVIPAHRPPAPR